jgi:hypothetical protein
MTPWSGWESASCIDGCQCELARDALIRQPTSFWTSAFFLIPVLTLKMRVPKKDFFFQLYLVLLIILSLASFFAHGSFTKIALAFDFTSIITLTTFFLLGHALQRVRFSPRGILTIFLAWYGLVFLGMITLGKFEKIGLCLLLFALAFIEVIHEKGLKSLGSPKLLGTLVIFFVSFAFFVLDENHVFCDPLSPWQLHGIWHLGASLGITTYSLWRFEGPSTSPAFPG